MSRLHDPLESYSHRWDGLSVQVVRRRVKRGLDTRLSIADTPTLSVLLEEIGGRSELRAGPTAEPAGYFGAGGQTFAPSGVAVEIHPMGALEVQIAVFACDLAQIERRSAASAAVLGAAQARAMFDDEALRECTSMLAAECQAPQNPAAYGAGLAQSVIAAASGALARAAPSGPQLTEQQFHSLSDYLERHLDQTVSPSALAALADFPADDFTRAFRLATGVSPQQWQIRMRILAAQRLMLEDSGMSLTEIAARLGFADQSHFSRLFKQFTGSAPRDWLRQRS